MNPTEKVRVKICCMNSLKEAKIAIKYGASAIGLVSKMPSGPGPISEDLISKIAKEIPPFVSSVLLTSIQDPSEIIAQHKKCQTDVVQFVDRIKKEDYPRLRNGMPGIKFIQVVHVTDEASIKEAISITPYVDGILLDSGNPYLKVKRLGGTGQIHNWDISNKIRKKIKIPIILAGGLNPWNVINSLNHVQPYAVDVCTGVRTQNILDEQKLSSFFKAINSYNYYM
jgi:phosphoribosylanthranilate isomerase